MRQQSANRGWKFPVKVDKNTGRIQMSQDEEDIHEAIILIVRTAFKERVMRPTFGCNIRKYIFGSNDSSTLALIEEEVRTSIATWEPRARNVAVTASYDGANNERILVEISYEAWGRLQTSTVPIGMQ